MSTPNTVSFIGYHGCSATMLMQTADLFALANDLSEKMDKTLQKLFDFRVVSPDGAAIRCSNGIEINANGSLSDISNSDIVIVHHDGALEGALDGSFYGGKEQVDPSIWEPIKQWIELKVGQFHLVSANVHRQSDAAPNGVLDNDRGLAEYLSNATDDIMSKSESNSLVDVCLSLIERVKGSHFSAVLSDALEKNWPSSQLSRSTVAEDHSLPASSTLTDKAEKWIQENISNSFSVEDLADQLAVSTRTLIRKFQDQFGLSPQSYIQKTRIERCKLLLETTSLRFSQIVDRCGYTDESAFRRLFKKTYQVSPTEYRKNNSNLDK